MLPENIKSLKNRVASRATDRFERLVTQCLHTERQTSHPHRGESKNICFGEILGIGLEGDFDIVDKSRPSSNGGKKRLHIHDIQDGRGASSEVDTVYNNVIVSIFIEPRRHFRAQEAEIPAYLVISHERRERELAVRAFLSTERNMEVETHARMLRRIVEFSSNFSSKNPDPRKIPGIFRKINPLCAGEEAFQTRTLVTTTSSENPPRADPAKS
ncbi:MAG TPA: hypothetical protein PK765_00675 [bacterium]|nr:hypothetical protein [bacterium]